MEEKEKKPEFVNKLVGEKYVSVDGKAVLVTRNAGTRDGTPYDNIKIKDIRNRISIRVNEEVASAIYELSNKGKV